MNKHQRERIVTLCGKLIDIQSELKEIQQQQQESQNKIPENLQSSQNSRYKETEYTIGEIGTSVSEIEKIVNNLIELK